MVGIVGAMKYNKSDLINNIIRGDTLSVLKEIDDNTIDLGVTSPPYNKQEKNKGWLVKNVVYNSVNDAKPESEYQEEQINILNELFRVIKEGGSFFYNHKIRWHKGELIHPIDWIRKTKWTVRQEIVWDRTIAANIRGWRFWQLDERIYWLYKPKDNNKIGTELKSKHAKMTSIWRAPPENKNPHPAPFPLWLPTRIIHSLIDENEDALVIDPYSGSGTSLLAAKLLGFSYLGIEISKDYIRQSIKRLDSIYEKQKVMDEISLHRVHKTFKERKENKENVGKFRKSRQLL